MKILKARNGIALIAVLTILLLTSLFIPVMFSMSDSSLAIAVKGTDRQRSSYLARTITEMSVAAFKSFDSTEPTEISGDALTQYNKINARYQQLVAGTISEIKTDTIVMLSKTVGGGDKYYKVVKNGDVEVKTEISYKYYKELLTAYDEMVYNEITPPYTLFVDEGKGTKESIVYANLSSDANSEYQAYLNDGYTEIGRGQCTITYDDSIKYYKTITSTQVTTEITKNDYDTSLSSLEGALANGVSCDYSLSTVTNKNVVFTSSATVKGSTSSRSCILVLQTYPSEEEWLVFGIESNGSQIPSGGNQVFVDPKKATSRIPIEYDQAIGNSYIKQTLLVYSSIGNMLIQPTAFKDASGNIHNTGNGNSEFVLGVQPGLNTTPNNDPSYNIIDGVNYNDSTEVAQMNNFVAFASTSAIQVDMPVNLLVNPCRAKRLGDGYIFGAGDANGSLYKIMMFQAPTIQFNGALDMMMSFYVRDNEEARRMSSIILSAPDATPYSYYNDDRKSVVKAGMVYFTEDCYLWIIPYGEDGSASAWTGFMAETIYYKDSDFTKIKIANAGDVYYFNSEVEVDGEKVGLSLTGYFLETEYIPKMEEYEEGSWWQIWNNTKTSIFANYMQGQFSEKPTYVEDDFRFVGNINDGDRIEYPEIDEYYTIWTN